MTCIQINNLPKPGWACFLGGNLQTQLGVGKTYKLLTCIINYNLLNLQVLKNTCTQG